MKDDQWTPKVAADILSTTSGKREMPVLLVTPRGEPLGVNGVRLPISAYSNLVRTLCACHLRELCHTDICPENLFAVLLPNGESFVLLNDWGSSRTFKEVAAADQFFTHKLYYDVSKMGAGEDLAALVRSVFVLTQITFPVTVETVQELDKHMDQQWKWGTALQLARETDYSAVELFLISGIVKERKKTVLLESVSRILRSHIK
jgi:hypothetical protein